MHGMKLLLLAHAAIAHTIFSNFYLDGANQGDATCVRMSNLIDQATSPVASITNQDMACGVNGETGVALVCPAQAGAVITFEFREWPDASHPGALDQAHKGPCAVYMKKVDDASASNNAAGDGWFKIFDDSYDTTSNKWCTERLVMDTNGLLSVKLPSDIKPGHYLIRPELLALHNAAQDPPDPQFYTGCAQVFINSTGSSEPSNKVSIPGYVDMEKNKAAMTFNIWANNLALPYPMFGPPVYGSSAKRDLENRDTTSQTTQTTGLKPQNCVLEVGNWCGTEIASYSSESSCWDASQQCWNQTTDCYNSAGPTGSSDCKIWENKCNGIQNGCKSGAFDGPPDAGKDLTPKPEEKAVPPPANVGPSENATDGTSSTDSPSSAETSQTAVSPTTAQPATTFITAVSTPAVDSASQTPSAAQAATQGIGSSEPATDDGGSGEDLDDSDSNDSCDSDE